MNIQGVWLPIITPFLDGELDYESYQRLIDYYIAKGTSGIIPLGTTGECPTISDTEAEQLIELTVETVSGRVPVYVGLGGNDTQHVLQRLKVFETYHIQGILSVCPYYNRPSQQGLFEHFLKISEATNLNIIIYNIPYRTGVNLENKTLLRLAERQNIVAVKDSCGAIQQSLELISQKPDNFSVLTGEDIQFYINLVHGGNGGISASSHLRTEDFLDMFTLVTNNDQQSALQIWQRLKSFIPLLFQEPNPAPLKYCLHQTGLIRSPEVRLPLTPISSNLQHLLEEALPEYGQSLFQSPGPSTGLNRFLP